MSFHPENNAMPDIIPFGIGGAAKNGINISLKNIHKAFVVCVVQQGADGTQVTFTLRQSTANAGSATGTDEKDVTKTCRVWYNENCALSNIVALATAIAAPTAQTYVTDIQQSRTKKVIFEVIPAECMDIANGFDCITVNSTDPTVANIVGAFVLLDPIRYAPLPTVYAD